MNNMHYNTRQKVEGVETLSKDENSIENTNKEDLISLNRILQKFGVKTDAKIEEYASNGEPCEILVKMWFNDCFPTSMSELKAATNQVKYDIEKYFGKQYDDKEFKYFISDMLSYDDYNNQKLDSKINIFSNGKEIYYIRLRIYGTRKVEPKKKKGKSKGKKRR